MSVLWHPTLTKSQTERLEAAQRRATDVIFGTSSVSSTFLHWRWLAFDLFRQGALISQAFLGHIRTECV